MAVLLVQHGKSLRKEIDPEQGLSDEGRIEVERIANVARDYRVKVSSIKHSGKKRARQSAEIFSMALNPPGGVVETSGLDPLDDVVAFARTIEQEQNIMIVGHLPFLELLTSYLITGSMDYSVFRFQNGGIVCLEYDADTHSWILQWTLMPNIGQTMLKKPGMRQ